MTNLIVFAFDNLNGASQMESVLLNLQNKHLFEITDAAIVTRIDNGKPKIKQLNNLTGAGAWGGAFWGLFIGSLFFTPWLGIALGALTGALAGKFSDIGIDDAFIDQVAKTIKPGHSAIFLMTPDTPTAKIAPHIQALHPQIIQTSLSPDQESKLRKHLAIE
jgi:uncharacterized membrane protein